MNKKLFRLLIVLLLLLFGSSDGVDYDHAPARRTLLSSSSSTPDKKDTAVGVTLDGTISLVYRDSGKNIWSFPTGSPIYSSYHAPINHTNDKEIASASEGSYFVDIGNDWKLHVHTNSSQVSMDIGLEDFIRITPHVSDEGGVILGSKKTTAYVVNANTGREIRVLYSSPESTHMPIPDYLSNKILDFSYKIVDFIFPKALRKQKTSVGVEEKPGNQLTFTRTDYCLTSYAPNSDKVLWNLSVAHTEVALLCQENPNPISVSLHNDLRSKSGDIFNMPLSCQSKAVVHRLHTPQIHGRQAENRAPVWPLPRNEPSVPHSDKPRKYNRDNDFETQDVTPLPSRQQPSPQVGRNPDYTVRVLAERRIAFVIISVLIIAIGFLMYRHHSVRAAMLITKPDILNAKSSSSRRRRHRKSGKNNVNEDGNAEADSEKGSPLPLYFNNLIECDMEGRAIGKLFVSSKEIAKGSNGTIVLEGIYDGRKVAVKRLVRAHHDVAFKEIQNLIASDQHPNIVRWYGVEYDHDFVYLSLERCACSLYDLIQMYSESFQKMGRADMQAVKSMTDYKGCLDLMNGIMHELHLWRPNGYPSPILLKLMRDIVSGLVHLHALGIIHRDLKPHNVLIVKENFLCGKLSDMGISRRLVGDMSSLGHHATGSGSSGWQAPEQLLLGRQTRAVDLFSLGCVLFYCITCGRHPFGDHLERDVNVAKNKVNLFLVEHIPEAVDLFTQLLNPNSELRPRASEVLHHPLFWNSELRLSFLRDASDRVELEDREVDSFILRAIESKAPVALGGKWDEKMEPAFITNIGRYRRYKYNSVRDLLRVIRNKSNHYRELPKEIQDLLGSVPEGYEEYFATRFPKLLIEVYNVMYYYCKEEEWFRKYLQI